jgi:RES domain-containing protein
VLCSYDVDCEDVVDLRTEDDRKDAGVSLDDMACAWFSDISQGREPASWRVAQRLINGGAAGVLVPSFAPGATESDQNLVLWKWGEHLPHKVFVYDPSGRLPKDQLSWK